MLDTMTVYFRPNFAIWLLTTRLRLSLKNLPDNGALPSAPKNAPAWKTETTLDDTASILAVFSEPSVLIKPKYSKKYGALTILPLVTRLKN